MRSVVAVAVLLANWPATLAAAEDLDTTLRSKRAARGSYQRTPGDSPFSLSEDRAINAEVLQRAAAERASWRSAHDTRTAAFPGPGCAKQVPLDEQSIWAPGFNREWHSCSARPTGEFAIDGDVRFDGASMCVDEEGRPDYTSLFVDLASLEETSGCFAWIADQCQFEMRRVSRLEVDVDLDNCGGLWAAPLWLSPLDWRPPQGLSGEVDLVEQCPVARVATNLGCWSLSGESLDGCLDGLNATWGAHGSLPGPRHIVMSLTDGGNWTAGGQIDVQVCQPDGSDCVTMAQKSDFLSAAFPTRFEIAKTSESYNGSLIELRSTVWNGFPTPEDQGWDGCNAFRNPRSFCRFWVRKISIASTDGTPLFDGKCAVLNAASSQVFTTTEKSQDQHEPGFSAPKDLATTPPLEGAGVATVTQPSTVTDDDVELM